MLREAIVGDQVTLGTCTEEIRKLIHDEQHDEALAQCQHVLQYYPKHIETYRLMAEATLEKGDLEGAQELFRRVLSADPENTIAYAGLGIVFEQERLPDEAIWHLERAHELAPGNAEIGNELLRLYAEVEGKPRTRMALSPGGLARLYASEGLFSQAAQEYRLVAASSPKRMDAQVGLAEALWRAGRVREAADVSEAVLRVLPYCLKANLILGTVLEQSGVKESQAHLDIAQALDPLNKVALELFGAQSPLPPSEAPLPRYAGDGAAAAAEPAPQAAERDRLPQEWLAAEVSTEETQEMGAPADGSATTSTEIPQDQTPLELPDWLAATQIADAPVESVVETPAVEEPEDKPAAPAWAAETAEVVPGETAEENPVPGSATAQDQVPGWLAQAPAVATPIEEPAAVDSTTPVVATEEAQDTTPLPNWLAAATAMQTETAEQETAQPFESVQAAPMIDQVQEPAGQEELPASEPTRTAAVEAAVAPQEPPAPAPAASEVEPGPPTPVDTSGDRQPASPKPAVAGSDLPPWLRADVLASARDAERPARPAARPTVTVPSALPPWLTELHKTLAEQPGSGKPETPAPSAEPAQETRVPAQPDAESQPKEDTGEPMPDRLAASGQEQPIEQATGAMDTAPEDESLHPVEPALVLPVSDEAPASVEPTPLQDQETDLPDWLEQVQSEPAPTTAEPPSTADVPAAPVESAAAESVPPVPVEIAGPDTSAPPADQTRQRRREQDNSRLDTAREHATAGRLGEALAEYDYIVQHAPRLVDQVIPDLEAIIAETSAPLEAHRVLGDAYTRVDRLAEALERYRFVLDRVS